MTVEVVITGNGAFAGARSNVGGYSVQEESSPVVASDTSGSVGQISFNAVDDTSQFGSMLLLNDYMMLSDGDRGSTAGRIANVSSNDGLLTVTADSPLGELVGERRAEWVEGTLEEVTRYYLGLAGITADIAVDEAFSDTLVVAPGFVGDMWAKLKELLVVFGAEVSIIRGSIVVRPIRSRRALEINNISETWAVARGELAETVEVAYYNTDIRTNEMVYPPFGWNEDVEIYQVDAGESKTINIPYDGWLSSVVQPVVKDYVSRDEVGNVYAVAGNDGKPITAAQWTGTGGALSVAVGEDGNSIDLTLTGATGASEDLAPFRIAMSSGESNYYSSLRFYGTGAVYEQKLVSVPSGAGNLATANESATVDNIFVRTESQARDIAAAVAGVYSAPSRTLTIDKADINKPGSSRNSYNYATFAQGDELFEELNIETFADFDAHYAGQTFEEFDNYWYSLVEDDFDFQVFGNANGARVQYRRNMYRIRSVTTTESSVNYTAEADTTFQDFDNMTAGMTFAEFDAAFEDKTFTDFALAPLLNVNPEYDNT